MSRKIKGKNKNNLVDKEYIKFCLAQSPKKRLEELAKLNKFVKISMPAAGKNTWKKLKEKGF